MKANIHPENYRTVLFYDSGANEGWLIRSCADTHGKTMVGTMVKNIPYFLWIRLLPRIPSIRANSAM